MLAVAVGPVAVAILMEFVALPAATIASPGRVSTIVVITGGTAPGSSDPQAPGTDASPAGKPAEPRRILFLRKTLARAVDAVSGLRSMVIGVWLSTTTCLGAILVLGARRLRRLCDESEPASLAIQEQARRLARRLRLRRTPRLLVQRSLAEPFLCGLVRPAIVLPGRWLTSASTDRLEAILAHELAHARRLDHLVNLAQRLVEVLFFFHPAVHWLSRSVRRERELCTDALAVRLTRNPLALAEALQSVAHLRVHFRLPAGMPLVGTSLGGQTISLLPRIQELIGMTPTRPQPRVWPFAALPLAAVLALLATAAGLARDDPSPAPAGRYGAPSSASPAQPAPSTAAESRPLISYQVRYCWLPAEPWRQLLLDRLKPIKQEADVSAWIMDDKALLDLLTHAQNDTRSNVLQAPKCTAYEGAHATIINGEKKFYVAGVDWTGKGFRPIVKDLEFGLKIDMTGSLLPRGTRLSVERESFDSAERAQPASQGPGRRPGCRGPIPGPHSDQAALRRLLRASRRFQPGDQRRPFRRT